MFRLLISLFVLVSFSFFAKAQDIHFSMFNNCPLYLNPASTGNFNGDWRFSGNYRNQWSALSVPFRTAAVSADKKFYLLHQDVAAGLLFVNDETGSLALSVNKIMGSLSFRKSINQHVFYFGLQLGYVFKSLNLEKVTMPNQYNQGSGSFDYQLPTGENNMGERMSNFDFNLGLLWKKKIGNWEPEVGAAFSHLNRPAESFFDDTEKLPVRSTIYGSVKAGVSPEIYLQPSLLYMNQKGSNETMAGFSAGFNIFGKKTTVKELFAGLFIRNGIMDPADAVAVMAGATVGRFDVAVCYDVTVSGLSKAVNNNGAFEISFAYKSISTVLNSYSIPCERF